jgi:putative ABC transport system permease protein
LGTVGAVLGLGAGLLLQNLFPLLFQGLLPPNVQISISGRALLESVLLGLVVVGSFTFLPIYQLEELKPSFIFRKEMSKIRHGLPFYGALLVIFAFFVGMVLWQLRDELLAGLYFILGVIGLLLIATGLTYSTLFLLRRARIKSLAVRQALRGLFRPSNATHAIIITLSAALAVIFCIYLLERNLDVAFVESYPEDAPNVFFVDIQTDQVAAFDQLISEVSTEEATYFPVVRASLAAVNGEPIDLVAEDQRPGENLARTFNLTYREQLTAQEQVIAGDSLFQPDWQNGAQVSIADEMLEARAFKLGDRITFRIQGVPLEATITSIRTQTEESMQPFFMFVFPPAALQAVPQSIFTAIHVPPTAIQALQNRVVATFPNITVIDATQAIANLASIANRLTQVIRFFTAFSIIAGVLIVISSVFATRLARIQEAAYYKVLGATRRFVLTVFTLENLLLGLVSALLALLMAQTGSWIICRWFFEIDYHPAAGSSLLLVALTMLLVTTVGLLASMSILRSKPITYLREQTAEE